jgi:hypothetical protein
MASHPNTSVETLRHIQHGIARKLSHMYKAETRHIFHVIACFHEIPPCYVLSHPIKDIDDKKLSSSGPNNYIVLILSCVISFSLVARKILSPLSGHIRMITARNSEINFYCQSCWRSPVANNTTHSPAPEAPQSCP